MSVKTPPLRAKNKKLRPIYVLALRLTAGLTQKAAAVVVHVSERTWRKWEGREGSSNHRYPPEACIELFCKKRGLVYPLKFNEVEEPEEPEKG